MSTEHGAKRAVTIEVSDEDETIQIAWDDDHTSILPWAFLRGACPCVLCKRNHLGVDIDQIADVDGVWLIDWMPVGNYAIRLLWSDAHETGIYDFGYLRELAAAASARAMNSLDS